MTDRDRDKNDPSRELVQDPKAKAEIAEEVADVLAFLISFANSAGIEVSSTSDGKFSLISDEKLLALYKDLLKCRIAGGRNGNSNGTANATSF